jgi:hypothetical protein
MLGILGALGNHNCARLAYNKTISHKGAHCMAAKPSPKTPSKSTPKTPVKATPAKVPAKPVKPAPKPSVKAVESPTSRQSEWLQDVSVEVPVPANAGFLPGDRELEFSVGMRQQEIGGDTRSELRARALVHAKGEVLVLVEASYVNVAPQAELRPDLPQYLYLRLREKLESILALTGHTPPLPPSLEKVA